MSRLWSSRVRGRQFLHPTSRVVFLCQIFMTLLLFLTLISGCANVANPFDSGGSYPSEPYYDQFSDIPIPGELTIDRDQSLVTVDSSGTKNGLLTAEGAVDRISLTKVVNNYMIKAGWGLRGQASGRKTVQIYEKAQRDAVIVFSDGMMKTIMEIWVTMRLNGSKNGINGVQFDVTPTTNIPQSSIHQEDLRQ